MTDAGENGFPTPLVSTADQSTFVEPFSQTESEFIEPRSASNMRSPHSDGTSTRVTVESFEGTSITSARLPTAGVKEELTNTRYVGPT